jgi:hypothetical protein
MPKVDSCRSLFVEEASLSVKRRPPIVTGTGVGTEVGAGDTVGSGAGTKDAVGGGVEVGGDVGANTGVSVSVNLTT